MGHPDSVQGSDRIVGNGEFSNWDDRRTATADAIRLVRMTHVNRGGSRHATGYWLLATGSSPPTIGSPLSAGSWGRRTTNSVRPGSEVNAIVPL